MTRKTRLLLPTDLKERLTQALGGKRVTAARLITLIESRTTPEAPMDKSDIEADRTPYTPRAHAETVGTDVGEALETVDAARARRESEGKDRVASRIADHRARGLDPNAPPEDPAAAALAEDGAGTAETPPLNLYQTGVLPGNEVLRAAEMDDEAIERLKAAGMARTREVADTLERRVLQRMPAIRAGGGKLRSLEEAAEILIGELQPGSQDAIAQVCAEHGLQPWVVVLGAVDRMATLQELHAGEFDPEWLNRAPGGGRPASVKEQKCQACGGVLPGDARRGQAYCCSFHGSNRIDHNPPESGGCSLSHLQMIQGKWVDTRGLVSR